MWLLLSAITHSKRGWKLLQAFLHDEAFSYRPQCAFHRGLELICVTVACLLSLFFNGLPPAEVEGVQIWWLWRPKAHSRAKGLWANSSCWRPTSPAKSLPSCHFLAWVVFEGFWWLLGVQSEIFLIEDLPLVTLRPSSVVPPDNHSFFRRSAALNSIF